MKERLIKNWVTSLMGLILMLFVIYKFMTNMDLIESWFQLAVYGVGALTGFLLFRSKDTWLINKAQAFTNIKLNKK